MPPLEARLVSNMCQKRYRRLFYAKYLVEAKGVGGIPLVKGPNPWSVPRAGLEGGDMGVSGSVRKAAASSAGDARKAELLVLLPGQWYVGNKVQHVRTLLGSCISLTFWVPHVGVGGMCHFILPDRVRTGALDGKYGEEAVELMAGALKYWGVSTAGVGVCLYGGADTQSALGGLRAGVGDRNIEKAWELIERYGFDLKEVDVGDAVPRTIDLSLRTGEVRCRRGRKIG